LAEIADRNDAQGASSKRFSMKQPEAGGRKSGAGNRFGNSVLGDGSFRREIARQARKLGQAGGSGDRTARSLGPRTLEAAWIGDRASDGRFVQRHERATLGNQGRGRGMVRLEEPRNRGGERPPGRLITGLTCTRPRAERCLEAEACLAWTQDREIQASAGSTTARGLRPPKRREALRGERSP